jgi:hypothetical protein
LAFIANIRGQSMSKLLREGIPKIITETAFSAILRRWGMGIV